MYKTNHLIHRLASVGDPAGIFATRADAPDVTYAALFAGAAQMAAALVQAGLVPGDRVAVQVTKSIEAVQLYLGAVMAGGVFLPLNTAYTGAEVGYFISDATPRIMVCDPDREAEITALAADIRVLTLAADGTGTLATAAATQDAGFEAIARGKNDLAAILYTSGTTGRSKGAMLSHGNLASNSATLRDVLHFTADDVLIHALPIFHTHGLFVATNVTLLAGASVHFLPGFDADAIVAALPTSTVLMGVPTFYTRLLDHPGITRQSVSNMRLFVSGSAPLLDETNAAWKALTGHTILERYGLTETSMNTSNPYKGERRIGTVGLPIAGVELRVMRDGNPAGPREVGMIEVRGPNVFLGYWQMPEKTAQDLRPDGWFITGDQGFVDKDGYVTIVGREKDMVISGGFNIYPKEVETLIDAVPGVRESAVIGVPHPDLGEAVVAVVVCTGDTLKEEAVIAALRDALARFKQPRKIMFLPELPRNSMGKVQKKTLREDYAGLFSG